MVALPTTKPPIWASNNDYSFGPDINTPTKVDATSISPNGHVPGKDFPSTAQEQNDWQNLASLVLEWDFDSISAIATNEGTNDPRVLSTDNLGSVSVTQINALGSTAAVAPTMRAFGSPAGAPTCEFVAGADNDGGVLVIPTGSQSSGFAFRAEVSGSGTMSGLLVEVGDPDEPGIDVVVLGGVSNGGGIGIRSQGGPGSVGTSGGHALVALGGSNGGAGGGSALLAQASGSGVSTIDASSYVLAVAGDAAIQATAFQLADALKALAVDGHAANLSAIGTGAPLRIAAQFTDPDAAVRDDGTVWVHWDAGNDTLQPQIELSTDNTRPWYFVTTEDQPVKLTESTFTVFENSAGSGTPTVIFNNVGFRAGSRPYTTPFSAIATFTCLLRRNVTDKLDQDDFAAAFFKLRDNSDASDVFEEAMSIPSSLGPAPGGDTLASAMTWDARNLFGSTVSVMIRRRVDIVTDGAGSYTMSFWKNDAHTGGTITVEHPVLTIETRH